MQLRTLPRTLLSRTLNRMRRKASMSRANTMREGVRQAVRLSSNLLVKILNVRGLLDTPDRIARAGRELLQVCTLIPTRY